MPNLKTRARANPVQTLAAGALSAFPILVGVAGVCSVPAMMGMAMVMAPEPDPIPRRWQLEIEPGPLRMVAIDLPTTGKQTYFYMTYKVTNNTSEDVLFAPSFEMGNDDGDLIRSGRDVPAEVTRRILGMLDNPLLQDQIGVLGMLLQGPANAKEGLVVWPAKSLKADKLNVYAGGFSGETRPVEFKDATTGQVNRILLRKQLMIQYFMPGDLAQQGNRPLNVTERKWIMR